MSKIILVVAAHPDDEALGCGGTIAWHVAKGDKVFVVFMADGVSSRGSQIGSVEHQERNHAALSSCEILGTQAPIFLGLPDNRMDSLALLDIVQPLESVINKIKPTTIYTHHFGDLNADHRITHQAVMTACRPQGDDSVKTILSFEVSSSTEWQTPSCGQVFEPNWFVDIKNTLGNKLKALSAYKEEMREYPHARSMKNIVNTSMVRGATVGMENAEAFVLVRNLT